MQEAQVGAEKVAVAQILKDHNVLVRGGPEQGTKLMDALVVSRCCIAISAFSTSVRPVHLLPYLVHMVHKVHMVLKDYFAKLGSVPVSASSPHQYRCHIFVPVSCMLGSLPSLSSHQAPSKLGHLHAAIGYVVLLMMARDWLDCKCCWRAGLLTQA